MSMIGVKVHLLHTPLLVFDLGFANAVNKFYDSRENKILIDKKNFT